MLIDSIKAVDLERVFPGTNPLIVESATYFKNLNNYSNSFAYFSIVFLENDKSGLQINLLSLSDISFMHERPIGDEPRNRR